MAQEYSTLETTPSPRTTVPHDDDAAEAWRSYAPGERIAGKYQLLRMLDQGGMGMVWVAHHLGLDVHVALKLVRPEVESPEAAERLVVEAQAAARLRHPAIVQVLDVGRTEEGGPFLVMELLDGECLADVLEREGRLDPITALRVILPVANALETMHDKGILHRDVKPDNVFLSHDDAGRWQPKLIDFGLARMDSRSRAGRITQRGAIVGTPVYLSPERIRGEDAGAQDDVWALCVMLYVMVTGALPFDGDNVIDVFVALSRGEPSSLASHGVNEPGLWDILRRGLGPREGRWPSVRALREALTAELLSRGATKDIAGLVLGAVLPSEPPSPPVLGAALPSERSSSPSGDRLRPDWQERSGRFVRPSRAQLLSPVASRPPPVEISPAPSEAPPALEARPRARIAPAALVGILGVAIGFIAGLLVAWR
jgi:serine/threonine-protein kinase